MSAFTRKQRRRAMQVLLAFGLVIMAVVLWKPLKAWFSGAPPGGGSSGAANTTDAGGVKLEVAQADRGPSSQHSTRFAFPAQALEYVRAAFGAYEATRALLANDRLKGLDARAAELAAALNAAIEAASDAPPHATEALRRAAAAAQSLAKAQTLEEARGRFSQVSEPLVALAAMDPRLQEGWHLFSCPMVKTSFKKWFQRSEQLANPHMGQQMLACGSTAKWEQASTAPPMQHEAHAGDEISHFTCPMHPSVRQDGPGACPICGMDLTPVSREEVETGIIRIDDARRGRIGVKTAAVRIAPMDLSFRALGRVTYDETALQDVTLKLDGYIHSLRVDATGQAVKKGDVLFTLYSPELYAAQQEYLLARNSQSVANASLVRASRKRLELWGLTSGQIDRIAEKGDPIENVPFLAPASGYVLEKNVVEGAAVKAGERLFRIAPLEKVWVEADVYEQNLHQVKVGQPVSVTLPYLADAGYQGKVAYIYPALDEKTRTGKIRIELANPGLVLKPDMYADVRFILKGEDRLQVPDSAVVYTGPRRLVFIDLGEGRLRPVEVKLGAQSEEGYEVLEGLEVGDLVVTSGNFLIAAESRIRSATDTWSGAPNDAE